MENGFVPVLIYLIVPFAGLLSFLSLQRQMHEQEIERPPTIALFLVFATYGGWLLVLLTGLFWYVSGMLYVGAFYLIFIAPILLLIFGIITFPDRRLSKYHLASFIASVAYPVFLGIIIGATWIFVGMP